MCLSLAFRGPDAPTVSEGLLSTAAHMVAPSIRHNLGTGRSSGVSLGPRYFNGRRYAEKEATPQGTAANVGLPLRSAAQDFQALQAQNRPTASTQVKSRRSKTGAQLTKTTSVRQNHSKEKPQTKIGGSQHASLSTLVARARQARGLRWTLRQELSSWVSFRLAGGLPCRYRRPADISESKVCISSLPQ